MKVRYLIRVRNSGNHKPSDLESVKDPMISILNKIDARLGNFRISTRAIEFDLFMGSLHKIEKVRREIEQHYELLTIRRLNGQQPSNPSDAIGEVRVLFREERFWECHEVLEALWKRRDGDEKDLLQGLILVCAALVHHQRDQPDICLKMLSKYRQMLSWNTPSYYGIDLNSLRGEVDKILSTRRVDPFLL